MPPFHEYPYHTRATPAASGLTTPDHCTDPAYYYPGAILTDKTAAATGAEIFGPYSLRPESSTLQASPLMNEDPGAVNGYILDGLLLALFLFYVFVVFRFRDNISFLFRIIIGKVPLNATVMDSSLLFRIFVNTVNVVGVIALTALLMKLFISFEDAITLPPGLEGYKNYAIIAICGAILFIFLFRKAINVTISHISTDRGFVQAAGFFDRIIFAFTTIIAAPLIMTAGFFTEVTENTFWILFIIVLIPLALYYLAKNFNFFVSGKVSVLQWFLYLCAVEILPVSFFALLVLRDFKI